MKCNNWRLNYINQLQSLRGPRATCGHRVHFAVHQYIDLQQNTELKRISEKRKNRTGNYAEF